MLAEPRDLKIDNLTNLAGCQTLEDDHGVNSIEKLRAEHPLQFLVDLLFRVLVAPLDLIGLVTTAGWNPSAVPAWLTSRMPRLEVMMITVLAKLTTFPFASLSRPSSRICNSMLNTSGCAFSISSKRITE